MKLKDVGETVASYLGKVGVNVKLNLIEPAAATERYQAKQFQMYFYAWGGDLVSGRILEILLHSKLRGYYYQSPEADAAIGAYQSAMNPRRREELGVAPRTGSSTTTRRSSSSTRRGPRSGSRRASGGIRCSPTSGCAPWSSGPSKPGAGIAGWCPGGTSHGAWRRPRWSWSASRWSSSG